MTVREVNEHQLLCEWFDKATLRSHTFLRSQLSHTNPEQLAVIGLRIGAHEQHDDIPPWERK
jgi:hypothetical protein